MSDKTPSEDSQLEAVAAEILALDPDGDRIAKVLRDTIDQLYDGQRTGRYRWDQLYKTEKTHCGTLVEINLQREFKFTDGLVMDYQIAGIEVDCKYSQTCGEWMFPPEALGHLCMVISAEDSSIPHWSLGLVRIDSDKLRKGKNRDAKLQLTAAARGSIRWLWRKEELPPNVLLQIDQEVVNRIMTISAKSGAKAVNELFRSALGMRVGRATVATVGQQLDFMRRIRANGGSRTPLQDEGIVILGQYPAHANLADVFGVPTPGPSETVAVRLVKADALGSGVAEIDGMLWRVAGPNDPPMRGPTLPSTKKANR